MTACTNNPTLSSITIQDFKDLFFRDFPYLPVWDDTKTYNTGDVIYYESTEKFYTCQNDGVTSDPTNATDWTVTADSIYNYILNEDISKAYDEACASINPSLFAENSILKKAYLYLSAHYLALDLRTASQGINSAGEYPVSSRSVGSVSESYSIPDKWLSSPILNFYTKTNYGLKYLNLVMPNMVGNIAAIKGATRP